MGHSREGKLPLYCPSRGIVGHGFSLHPIARCHAHLLCDSLCSPVAHHKAKASSVMHPGIRLQGFNAYPPFLPLPQPSLPELALSKLCVSTFIFASGSIFQNRLAISYLIFVDHFQWVGDLISKHTPFQFSSTDL